MPIADGVGEVLKLAFFSSLPSSFRAGRNASRNLHQALCEADQVQYVLMGSAGKAVTTDL